MPQCIADTWAAPGNLLPFHCWMVGPEPNSWVNPSCWRRGLHGRPEMEGGGRCCRNELALDSQEELSMEVDAKCLHCVSWHHTLTWVKDKLARSPMQRGLPRPGRDIYLQRLRLRLKVGLKVAAFPAGLLRASLAYHWALWNLDTPRTLGLLMIPRIHSVRASRDLGSSRTGRRS